MTDSEKLDLLLADMQNMKSDMQNVKNDLQEVKQKVTNIDLTLENESELRRIKERLDHIA